MLLERDDELRALDEVLAAARDHVGGLLLLRGDPGVGKTGIVRAGIRLAAASAMTVLRTRATPLERDFAWGAVHGLLARAPKPAQGAALLARPVLGAAPDAPPPAAIPDREARHAVAHGLYWHVADLAADRPLAIFVDDAHWADTASLSFLVHLAGRLDGLPVALVVAARSLADEAQGRLLSHLESLPGARCRTPAPLSAAAVRALVSARLGAEASRALGDACHRETGGNPFLASELAEELRRAGPPAAGWDAAAVPGLRPPNVARSVAARLADLPAEATALAHAVAVLGGRPETHLAARVAGEPVERATRTADLLTDAGILVRSRPLDFVHPIVEAAVLESIPPGTRALAHQRAFDALSDDGADPLVAAPHLLRTEPRGCARTVSTLCDAARGATDRGDPDTAVALLERALRETASARRCSALVAALGRAELASGRDDGVQRLHAAIGLSDDPAERAGLALAIATARYERGETDAAQQALAAGLAEPLAEDDETRLSLLATDLTIRRSLVDPVQAVAPDAVAETLRHHGAGRSPLERLTLAHLAFRGLQTGAMPHGTVADLARRALPPDGPAGASGLDEIVLPLAGMALYFSDVEAEAEAAFTAAIGHAQSRGVVLAFATASFFRGSARYLRGALRDAADDFDAALETAGSGWAHSLPSAHALRALVAMEQDEPDRADELLALPGGDDPWRAHPTYPYVLCVRGVRAVGLGRPAEGRDLLLRAGERQAELGIANPAVLHWQAEAAMAALAAGAEGQAEELAADLLARAERYGAARPLGIALRTAGTVRGAGGVELLERAVRTLAPSGARLEHARALFELGAARRRAGHPTEARESLRAAADLAGRCGAAALVARSTEQLRMAGGRPRRPRTSGAAALTSGERRVASLAAEGLTNREIAQRLFVTLRTVETHLTHAYAKLDTDRAGLAGALRDDQS